DSGDDPASFALVANNLSDLANITTARTNLGLGDVALQTASSVALTGGTISGLGAAGTPWLRRPGNLAVNHPSGHHYNNSVPAASFLRVANRAFIGAATVNDGNPTGAHGGGGSDWLTLLRAPTVDVSQAAALSTTGRMAVLGGTRSSDNPEIATSMDTI